MKNNIFKSKSSIHTIWKVWQCAFFTMFISSVVGCTFDHVIEDDLYPVGPPSIAMAFMVHDSMGLTYMYPGPGSHQKDGVVAGYHVDSVSIRDEDSLMLSFELNWGEWGWKWAGIHYTAGGKIHAADTIETTRILYIRQNMHREDTLEIKYRYNKDTRGKYTFDYDKFFFNGTPILEDADGPSTFLELPLM